MRTAIPSQRDAHPTPARRKDAAMATTTPLVTIMTIVTSGTIAAIVAMAPIGVV
ncbi:MAG TPA: hypothetical protein GX714_03120 [Chloroflexi bacterium]|jgi:hypothetical protein|nr:hypothetical protein [Chloroflexota bacterium]